MFPDRGQGWTLTLQPLDEAFFGGMRQPLLLLQTAVGLVLLIACANLAALILTRAVSRQRELAVRAALGQSRASIVTQLMIESVLLSLAAGVVGAFATLGRRCGRSSRSRRRGSRGSTSVGIDARVFPVLPRRVRGGERHLRPDSGAPGVAAQPRARAARIRRANERQPIADAAVAGPGGRAGHAGVRAAHWRGSRDQDAGPAAGRRPRRRDVRAAEPGGPAAARPST